MVKTTDFLFLFKASLMNKRRASEGLGPVTFQDVEDGSAPRGMHLDRRMKSLYSVIWILSDPELTQLCHRLYCRCVGVWVWERRGQDGTIRGVTSVSEQPGADACVFDFASAKLAWTPFHGQHIAHGINKRMWWLNTAPLRPEKEQHYSPELHLHSQTLLMHK